MGMLVLLVILFAGVFSIATGLILLIVWAVRSRRPIRTFSGTGVRQGASDDTWMHTSGAAWMGDSGSPSSTRHDDDDTRQHVAGAVVVASSAHHHSAEASTDVSGSHCGGTFDSGSSDSGSSSSCDSGSSSSSSSGD
jgi:hypothetical protein